MTTLPQGSCIPDFEHDEVMEVCRSLVIDDYMIEGEPFHLEREDSRFVLSHPKWSTVGYGDTILGAEWDLIERAQEIAPVFMNKRKMSYEANRLTDWLHRIVGYKRS